MNAREKKRLGQAVVGAVLLWAVVSKARASGQVQLGPVTVTTGPRLSLSKSEDAELQRLTLALTRSRQLMAADPNTLVSRRPSDTETKFIESTLALGRQLSTRTGGRIPYPSELERMLALAVRLPGDDLLTANRALYQALGVDPTGDNEATLPLTAERDRVARAAISKWRPYSQAAVDTLFTLLDGSRELATGVS